MASEQIDTPPVVAADDNVASDAAESTQQQAPQSSQDDKKGAKQQPTRQRVPPEQLYDLTKPIPRVSLCSSVCPFFSFDVFLYLLLCRCLFFFCEEKKVSSWSFRIGCGRERERERFVVRDPRIEIYSKWWRLEKIFQIFIFWTN